MDESEMLNSLTGRLQCTCALYFRILFCFQRCLDRKMSTYVSSDKNEIESFGLLSMIGKAVQRFALLVQCKIVHF